MNRREFLKQAAIAGASVAFPGSMSLVENLQAVQRPDLAGGRGLSPEKITKEAIGALGGIGSCVSQGDIVVVKPNIGWDWKPEMAANTNPEVVATLVKMCYEAGAKRVKVFDRSVNDPRRCYKQSGIADAARNASPLTAFHEPPILPSNPCFPVHPHDRPSFQLFAGPSRAARVGTGAGPR